MVTVLNIHDTGLTPVQRRKLRDAGLGCWIRPCNELLRAFDGMEEVLEDGDLHPSRLMSDIVREAVVAQSDNLRDERMLEALMRWPLFRYRARRGERMWNPLVTPFAQFQDGSTRYWEHGTMYPSTPEIRRWLLMRTEDEPRLFAKHA
ncbi:MAG: hypothetical protein ACR2RB_10410 [Gammaproteobacteria bacterium]